MSYTSDESYLLGSSSAKEDADTIRAISILLSSMYRGERPYDKENKSDVLVVAHYLESGYAKIALENLFAAWDVVEKTIDVDAYLSELEALYDDEFRPVVSDIEEALDMGSNENDEHRTYI